MKTNEGWRHFFLLLYCQKSDEESVYIDHSQNKNNEGDGFLILFHKYGNKYG